MNQTLDDIIACFVCLPHINWDFVFQLTLHRVKKNCWEKNNEHTMNVNGKAWFHCFLPFSLAFFRSLILNDKSKKHTTDTFNKHEDYRFDSINTVYNDYFFLVSSVQTEKNSTPGKNTVRVIIHCHRKHFKSRNCIHLLRSAFQYGVL